MLKRITFLFFLPSILILSCTQRVYLTVNEPPPVHIDKNYEKVGLVNRSFTEDGPSKIVSTIDKALTLEGNVDLKGSNSAIDGAYNYLTAINRFEYLAILDSLTVNQPGITSFPAPLKWDEVQQLCLQNNVEFIISLEVYDTDTRIAYSTGTTTKQTPLGTINIPVHNATLTTHIKTGWRIYDPKRLQIIDQFWANDQIILRGSGINPLVAAAAIINRENAIIETSSNIGEFYTSRIEPQQFRVWRNYFNKGSKNLKIARRRSEVGNWEGAAELWEKDLNHPKRKAAGRAHYNMAIYKEISGDVYGALEMAQKSYSDYRIQEGLTYANILKDRIQRMEREQALNQE